MCVCVCVNKQKKVLLHGRTTSSFIKHGLMMLMMLYSLPVNQHIVTVAMIL